MRTVRATITKTSTTTTARTISAATGPPPGVVAETSDVRRVDERGRAVDGQHANVVAGRDDVTERAVAEAGRPDLAAQPHLPAVPVDGLDDLRVLADERLGAGAQGGGHP